MNINILEFRFLETIDRSTTIKLYDFYSLENHITIDILLVNLDVKIELDSTVSLKDSIMFNNDKITKFIDITKDNNYEKSIIYYYYDSLKIKTNITLFKISDYVPYKKSYDNIFFKKLT